MASSSSSQGVGKIQCVIHVTPRDDGRPPRTDVNTFCTTSGWSEARRINAADYALDCVRTAFAQMYPVADTSPYQFRQRLHEGLERLFEETQPPSHLNLGRLELSGVNINLISGSNEVKVKIKLDSSYKFRGGSVDAGGDEHADLDSAAQSAAERTIWDAVARTSMAERSEAEGRGRLPDMSALCSAVADVFPIGIPDPAWNGGVRYVFSEVEISQAEWGSVLLTYRGD